MDSLNVLMLFSDFIEFNHVGLHDSGPAGSFSLYLVWDGVCGLYIVVCK